MMQLTVSQIVGKSWEYLKSQIWVLVGLMIGYSIVYGITYALQTAVSGSILMTLVMAVIGMVIAGVFYLGYVKNMFQVIDGEEPQFSVYAQQAGKLLSYIVAGIIFGILMTIGLVLLVIPGIYIIIRLQFYMQAIVEEDAGPLEALNRSWEITKGHEWQLFVLGVVAFLLILLGIILLVVGVFVTIPLVYMMQCYVYRLLTAPDVADVAIED